MDGAAGRDDAFFVHVEHAVVRRGRTLAWMVQAAVVSHSRTAFIGSA